MVRPFFGNTPPDIIIIIIIIIIIKGKPVQLQARGAQRVPGKLRFPDYVTMAQGGG